MLELLAYLVAPLAEFFAWIFFADERPEARRITVGCAVIVFVAIGLLVLWMGWQRGWK